MNTYCRMVGRLVCDETDQACEKDVFVLFTVLSRYLSGGTGEAKTLQSR